ncbi:MULTISPECIES: hypothetical protein [Bacillus]|uniref:Uncharacterized protein n=1 Tax=Bacillus glycinifermentans TaxID=1664069 RepID=A0AAJ3YWM9_9BACI|nr:MULTISPECIES: hypothetical protein [Bacillus]MDU0071532.1 hypothetical protein [Bacillus sp. IG6]MED8019375.1 hypothetical protein [Bacillus glycinifermentans]QAT64446.1 hypothetical protein EQZ20_05680 [Bacillus glycinifermentans]SCA84891.1 hypothetical protein BGLY_1068 [Bacillus glycinifermentans]
MNLKIQIAAEKDVPAFHQLQIEAFWEYRFPGVPSSALTETAETLKTALQTGARRFMFWRRRSARFGKIAIAAMEKRCGKYERRPLRDAFSAADFFDKLGDFAVNDYIEQMVKRGVVKIDHDFL